MPILRSLFLLFLLIPLLEIYLLIKVGGVVGAWPTVFLVVFTAVLGAWLLRYQGVQTLTRARRSMAVGELPTVAMLEGVILLLCGALLLTPGFFTDAIGFLGLVPPLRQAMIVRVLERGIIQVHSPGAPRERGPSVIEGNFRREEE